MPRRLYDNFQADAPSPFLCTPVAHLVILLWQIGASLIVGKVVDDQKEPQCLKYLLLKFVKLKKRELKEFSSQSEEDAYNWQRNNAIDC